MSSTKKQSLVRDVLERRALLSKSEIAAGVTIPHALDALNFLSADVRNLFGPFINVFLVTSEHWTQTDVGLITTGSGLLGIALQTPIGAAIDVTRAKRAVIVGTMAAMTLCAIIIYALPTFWPMALATSVLALAGDAFVPAVAALTLGLVTEGGAGAPARRNSAFHHGGNIAIALVAGGVGYLFTQRVVFLLVPLFAALTVGRRPDDPGDAIDHDRARDLGSGRRRRRGPGFGILFRSRPLDDLRRMRRSSSTSPMRRSCRWSDRSSRCSFPRKRRR